MNNRRDFVKWLALIAAGVAARPEQILAFERYYEANTPAVDTGLIAIDEIFVSGMAYRPISASLLIGNPPLRLGLNLYGGIIRWVAQPDQKMILPALAVTWDVSADRIVHASDFQGHISYVDQNARRHYRPLTLSGSLA